MAIVYRHRRLDTNEIFYVGIGKTEKRAYVKHQRNIIWHRITNKTDYKVEIMCQDLLWEEACDIEKYLIKYYGRRDLGLGTLVNLTDGGDGQLNGVSWNKGKTIKEETKLKTVKNTKLE